MIKTIIAIKLSDYYILIKIIIRIGYFAIKRPGYSS
jgi:hypothetical protein